MDTPDQYASISISGSDMKAVSLTVNAMSKLPDLPRTKKRIENYTIQVSKNKYYYYIHFIPNHTVGAMHHTGGENEFGREMLYTVRRSSYKIVKIAYYR